MEGENTEVVAPVEVVERGMDEEVVVEKVEVV